jgi:holin-like protein
MFSSVAASAPSLSIGAGIPRRLRPGCRLAGRSLLLVVLFFAGAALAQATAMPLPGNLVGILLLLALLRLGIVRLEHVEAAAGLLLKHLNLFFIPLAVGLMAWGGLLGASGLGLGVSLAGSAAVCLAVAGFAGQRLARTGGASDVA